MLFTGNYDKIVTAIISMNLFLTFQLFLLYYFNQILALTTNERNEFLDFHNYLRRSVVPTASNMQELEYDENIEKSVYEFLEFCKFDHRKLDGYGENGRLASDSNITNTLMSWFQERTFFNIYEVGDQRCSKENTNQEYLKEVQCGHYKMMTKGSLKSLGCGYKFCEKVHGTTEEYDNSYITYCFYNSGQMDQPYEIGKPCGDCSTGYQFCKDDLCVPKKRYDKTSRTCQIKCKNCADYFDSKNSCLCDCPEGTDGNTCIGTPNNIDKTCTPCGALGETCNNGFEDVNNGKCNCKCSPEYQGEYCEIKKDQYAASYYFIIDGINWRYNMRVPANIVKFKNTFNEFQEVLADNVNKYCTENQCKILEYKPILENPIISDNVLLISGFPKMLENGSVAIRMFINFSVLNNGEKQEKYLVPSILHEIWTKKSIELNKYIENVRNFNSPDPQYYDRMHQDFKESSYLKQNNILNNLILEGQFKETTDYTTTTIQNITESLSQYTSQYMDKSISSSIGTGITAPNKTLATTNIPESSNTVDTRTKASKVNSTKEYQSTNIENTLNYSEKISKLTSESVRILNLTVQPNIKKTTSQFTSQYVDKNISSSIGTGITSNSIHHTPTPNKTLATFLTTNAPESSNTVDTRTKASKVNSTKEYPSTNIENTVNYSEKISVHILNITVQSINYTSTTDSTNDDPKTTEKSANKNCQVLKGFILLQIIYIYITS